MAEDKKPGILDDLFGGGSKESDPGTNAFDDLLYRGDEKNNPKDISGQANLFGSASLDKKVTHYISQKVSVDLSDAKAKIRIMVPPNLKSKVSMSRIVNIALSAILNELKAEGKKSALVQEFLKEEKKKNSNSTV